MPKNEFTLEVWGDLACFTRPELKVERFSYPIITPSAARAIFESILWKPEFRWAIKTIQVLKLPRYIALRRNEVKEKAPSERTINGWMKGTSNPDPIIADLSGEDFKGRTQRQTMALKDVKYRITAEMIPWDMSDGLVEKYGSQFQRRALKGQCVNQPYFGCREFPAYFKLVDSLDTGPGQKIDMDIGIMLFDVFDLRERGSSSDGPFITFFKAVIKENIINVPSFESALVIKPKRSQC